MTEVRCGGVPALLLGPLTVEPAFRSRGIGEGLIATLAGGRPRVAGHTDSSFWWATNPITSAWAFKRVAVSAA